MVDDEGKFRESIWSINPNWRGWFYGVLSICGVAVSAFTLYDEWSNGWLEIFDEIRNGIVNSVVVVWFLFQVADWIFENIINKIMAWGDPAREKLRDEGRKEEREKARKEAEAQARRLAEYQKQFNEELLKQGVTKEQIRKAHHLSGTFPPSMM